MIKSPDYIGTNSKYPNSVEYIKRFTKNILLVVRSNNCGVLCVQINL
ncbi:MAG: hypothetical protein KKE35_01715 [Actinobacteria bacterium]|nr:hypothetical protein [Actinomycetota bacterium]